MAFHHLGRFCGAALLASVASLTPAGAEALKGDSLRDTIADRRIFLAVPLGGEFPLYYRADGRVSGDGEAVGLGRYMRPTDQGRWWVEGERLCQQWTQWYDGQRFCFTLRRLGPDRLAWKRDDGLSGTARIGR